MRARGRASERRRERGAAYARLSLGRRLGPAAPLPARSPACLKLRARSLVAAEATVATAAVAEAATYLALEEASQRARAKPMA